jgi:hypothetical protein
MPLWMLFFEGVLSLATTLGGAFGGRPLVTLVGLAAVLVSAFCLVGYVRWLPDGPAGSNRPQPGG